MWPVKGVLLDLIEHNSQVELSGRAIERATGRPPVIYDRLANMSNIDELLPHDGSYETLLYVAERGQGSVSGHYCFTFRSGDTIHFFDSYGLKPDGEFAYDVQGEPWLRHLLDASPYRVVYNHTRYQDRDDQFLGHTSLCGAYCILRHATLAGRLAMDDETFDRLLSDNQKRVDPDTLVTLLTMLAYA